MVLIAGSFRITGAQPDGDSIRFTPDDPANWDLITGTRVKRNASGAAQLRLESDAIDALETHYGSPRSHQPLDLAHAAVDELLTWLGFTNVVRGQNETVTLQHPRRLPESILVQRRPLLLKLHPRMRYCIPVRVRAGGSANIDWSYRHQAVERHPHAFAVDVEV